MLMKSNKMFFKMLICSTFISTNSLVLCAEAHAQTDAEGDINPQLLAPNEAVNDMTDMERTRRYYDTRKSVAREQPDEDKQIEKAKTDDEIKLPPRKEKNAISVHIYRVEMPESEIFSKSEIYKFTELLQGKDATAEDINNFINILNEQYLKKGIITARAFVKEGSLNGGVLQIELMEAHIGELEIDGLKYNREWFIRSQMSHKDGDIFSLVDLQKDLKTFNKNSRSIKMRAELKPGKEYGTTDIKLVADESFPYHLSTSFDNFGRDTTGEHRGGILASADSLLGFQDRLAVAFNLARSSFNPYIDYSVPVNRHGTRAGVSYMYGKSKVTSGEYKDFDLISKTTTISAYVTHPLIDTSKGKLNISTSINEKFSTAEIAGMRYSNYRDYSVAVGLGGNYNFEKSVFYGSTYVTRGTINDKIRHDHENFTKFNADGYYVHYLPWGIVGTFKAGGQYSPDNIAYVEQYQIGGISSVRGYSEGVVMAPSSYYASAEMLFPIPFLPETIDVPFTDGKSYRLRDSVKFASFIDHGVIFPHKGKINRTDVLFSYGFGLRAAVNKYVSTRFYVGFPLMNRKTYRESDASFHFDLVATPF